METNQSPASPELTATIDLAVDAAQRARTRAYSPYSDFKMGAGLVGDSTTGESSQVVMGTLIENVSLGLAMCSERVALFTAITQGLQPRVLALCSPRTEGELTFPCGACLQVALELAGPELIIAAVDTDGNREHARLADLIPRAPHRFTPATRPNS